MQACEKPEVMSAVFQCAEDSSKMAEYEHDPDVKMVCARPLLVYRAHASAHTGIQTPIVCALYLHVLHLMHRGALAACNKNDCH